MKFPAILKNPDVIGWIVWILLTLLLTGPCIYFVHLITYNDTTPTLKLVVSGAFIAAISAAVLSWLGNEVWFRFKQRQYAEKRKAARKEKRRKK